MALPFLLSTGVTEPLSAEIQERDPELHYETEYSDAAALQDGASSKPARSSGWPLRLLSAGVSLVAVDLVYRKLTGRHILYQTVRAPERSNGHQDETPSPTSTNGVQRTLTISAPPDVLYQLWQQPDTLNRVMGHVGQVTANADGSFHWELPGPLGQTLAWDTRTVTELPGELIRWESVPGAAISNAGEIRFRPGPPEWGTETTLHITVSLPLGIPGEGVILKLMNPAPQLLLGQALRRFKSLAETGEIPTLHHQPAVRDSGRDS